MGKQWVRAQIKRNEVQNAVDGAISWVAANRRTAGIAGGCAAAAVLLGLLLLYSYRARRNDAWNQLSLANGLAYSGQIDAAIKTADELDAKYPSSDASGYGLLLAGDILYSRERFAESVKYYQRLLDKDQPKVLMPFALTDLAEALEADNKCPEATQTAERFLAAYPDNFLAPQTHAALARCQLALGQLDAAKAALQKIALQYPDTSWAAWAQARLKSLSEPGK
ncbi:MAG: tetratricopeptide repeat protein [Elusimicrobia bacterium]|nr:tetratricopeptide repeat protein [Elusimicrobiota bacterium]